MSGVKNPRGSNIELLLDMDSDIDRFRHGLLPPRIQRGDVMPWNEVAYGSLVNLPRSAKDFAVDTFQGVKHMVQHPVDTVSALKDLAVGTVQLPIPGEQGKEAIPRELARLLGERYGGEDAIKQTLHDDPAGMASDLLMLIPGLGAAGAFRASTAAGKLAQAAPEKSLLGDIKWWADSDRNELLHKLGGGIEKDFNELSTPEEIASFGVGDLAPGLDGLIHFYEPGTAKQLDTTREFGVKARSEIPIKQLPEVPDLRDWNPVKLMDALHGEGIFSDKEIDKIMAAADKNKIKPGMAKDFDVLLEKRFLESHLGYKIGTGPNIERLMEEAYEKFKVHPDSEGMLRD